MANADGEYCREQVPSGGKALIILVRASHNGKKTTIGVFENGCVSQRLVLIILVRGSHNHGCWEAEKNHMNIMYEARASMKPYQAPDLD